MKVTRMGSLRLLAAEDDASLATLTAISCSEITAQITTDFTTAMLAINPPHQKPSMAEFQHDIPFDAD
ncbi:hypothetical protein [Neiella marina]|uniref:hypothetical protein n=1 Tax=Neiella marina TaxID=508461 RepID=UPI001E2904F2|nr:hypothetical protein [Neiella marina]